MAQQYEPDEFDQIASEGGPVGVHRAPRPWWTHLLPPILGFLIAGLLALGIALLLWNRDLLGSSPAPTPTITVTPSEEPSSSPEPSVTPTQAESPEPEEPEAEPEPEPSQPEEPEPVILHDAQVHVRNGAGIQGLAGTQQELLEAAGYTNTDANNISRSLIPDGTNVVTYSDERLADTAQDVADTLGIEAVDGGGTPGGAEIEVLLASNPSS